MICFYRGELCSSQHFFCRKKLAGSHSFTGLVSCSVGGTEQCRWTLIMDVLARCVRCFNYSIRDFCFINTLLFHCTHAAGCSQSYHAKILAGAGNSCNLLLSFMSHGEHTISQFCALHYLPTNFWMCFWDLSSIYEKLRPGCLGNGFFYPPLHQDSHAGCSFWLVQKLKFEVPWNHFFSVNAPCYFRFSLEQNLVSCLQDWSLRSSCVCPGILQNLQGFFWDWWQGQKILFLSFEV